jgi:CelD/BcsL family acetyltransferase involved in cellulose biosynthesis
LVQRLQNRLKDALRRLVGRGFERFGQPSAFGDFQARCDETWDLPFLGDAWNRLHASVETATTFQSHTWQQAVIQTLGKPGRLRLITVWKGPGALVAVVAMTMRDDGLLESLGAPVSDYLDPLIDPARERDVWPVLLKVLSELRSPKRPTVTLHNIRDAAPCRAILRELAPAEGFCLEEKQVEATPVLSLPTTWDGYLAALDPHERKETRRKLNKVQTKAQSRLVRCSPDPAEIAKTLSHTFALMEQAPGEKGHAIRTTIRPLLEKAAPPMIQSGQLWLTTLYLDNEPAAVSIEFPHATGPQLYNCGFDAAKKEWSPGVVLTCLIIQQAIESGSREFDLLRGREPYKYKLGAKDRPLWMITLRKS